MAHVSLPAGNAGQGIGHSDGGTLSFTATGVGERAFRPRCDGCWLARMVGMQSAGRLQ